MIYNDYDDANGDIYHSILTIAKYNDMKRLALQAT